MLLFLTFRYLGSHKTRTSLLIGAIALVTIFVAMMQAQLQGLRADVFRLVIRDTVGDAQIVLTDSAGKTVPFTYTEAKKTELASTFHLLACLPTLHTQAWLQQDSTNIPLRILGRDKWAREDVKGLTLSPALCEVLKLKVGDSVYLKPAPDRGRQGFLLMAIRALPLPASESVALLPLEVAQKFAQMPHKITAISLQYDGEIPVDLPAWVGRQGLLWRTWQQASPEVRQMLLLLEATFALVSSVLYILLGFSVAVIFVQNWRERLPEIQRLRILGMTVEQVWAMLVLELTVVLAIGYVLGILLVLPTLAYGAMHPINLTSQTATALQSVGFPARVSFGWAWTVVLVPLVGWIVIGLGMIGMAFSFAKKK